MSFMSNLKRGDVYKSFEVLTVFDVPDYHSLAIHLRHQKTGLEVFHLLNDDPENLFAFALRTPNRKSNGLAHIIEHSVLCGSERFPLKDPFVILSNQSVKTYLNAMTYADKTVYPASSIAKADYFNLMAVYGDAVFFPLLSRETFMQEAHRLEIDENGIPSIQGVVYNEMKGSYSSFDSVAADISLSSLLKGSIYEKDSGGDPLEISSVTYDEFLDFHKRWYRPDNCLIFLSGDIPTEEQLDFINDNFIERLEKKFPSVDLSEQARQKKIEEFKDFVSDSEIDSPFSINALGPSGDGEENNTVLVNWHLGRAENALSSTEKVVLTGILCNHDGSPLQKALIESSLGEDIAPQTGLISSMYSSVLTVGLRGVKAGDESKVEKVILDTVKKLVENGIPKKDIESTLLTMEFSHREIKRGHGPFALSLMSRPIYGWMYGDGIENQIRLRSHLEQIKSRIENDENYLRDLMKNLLLLNKKRSLVTVSPSRLYNEKRESAEKAKIEELMAQTSPEVVKLENEKLHAYQKKQEDESCLPHLSPSDFISNGHPMMNRPKIEIDSISGSDGKPLPFIKNVENTNGIIYFDIGFPADVLSSSDYPLLPAFADCVSECGWKNLDWARAAEECAINTGGLGVNLLTMEGPCTKNALNLQNKYNWIKRDWIIFRISMLEERALNALSLLKDCITGTDFSDEKRIQDVLNESRNDFESSIIPDGHIFMSNRVICQRSRKTAVDEIWNGISQYYTIKKLADSPIAEITANFRRIFGEIKRGGAFIHATAEKSGFDKLCEILPDFINETALIAPLNPRQASDKEFYILTDIPAEKSGESDNELFTTSSQVGYAAECLPASRYENPSSYIEEVCAHWLSNNLLWEKIRTIGGAYGAFCNAEPMSGALIFATYRDPNSLESCSEFENCLREAAQLDFSEEEVEKAVMGCYSHFIQPQSPKGRGASSLTRLLYGITDDDRECKILGILSTKADDLKSAFVRLYEGISSSKSDFTPQKAVISGKKNKVNNSFAGKIINLPL